MTLLDEQQLRWYCFKDDQLYYTKQNHWGPLPESDSPVFQSIGDVESPTKILAVVLGGAALLLIIFGLGKVMGDYGAWQDQPTQKICQSLFGGAGSSCYYGIPPWSWNLYFGFHPEVLASLIIGIVLLILVGVLAIINPPSKVQEPVRAQREISQPVTRSSTMYCRECGARIPRTSKYCGECGAKLI